MDLLYILQVVLGFLGVFILAVTYTYIDKLEKTGCACSEHPYRSFIKKYHIFAIIFLALIMFIPVSVIAMLGPVGTIAIGVLKLLFLIATLTFFVMAIIYVRYLMKEKCKCSEDMRREVLYLWAIAEIAIIAGMFLIPYMVMAVNGGVAFATFAVKEGIKTSDQVMDTVVNPLKSAKKFPGALKKNLKMRA